MPDIGIVDLKTEILENFLNLYKKSVASDVILAVKGAKLPAHRFVLAAHSKFFQVLLYGQGFNEANQPEVTVDAPANAMKMLLEFSYSGALNLRSHDLLDVADLLELAHRYELTNLEDLTAEYLSITVDAENASYVLNVATLVGQKELEEQCWLMVEMIVEGIFDVELNLTYKQLQELLSREPRKVTEVKLFQAANKLTQKENFCTEEQKNEIFACVQYSRMTEENLLDVVEPTNVIPARTMLDLIKTTSLYKAKLLDETNAAVIPTQAKILKGTNPEFLFQTGNQCTTHNINSPMKEDDCISVDLGSLYVINCFKIKTLSVDLFFGYYIETSRTGVDWTKVVDYSLLECNDKQELYFSDVVAKYVKFVAVQPVGKYFQCNSFEVRYINNPPKFLNGWTYPKENAAIPEKAIANIKNSEKKLDFESQLLNGVHEEAGTDTPFTAQIIENGSLLIQFNQPYLVSSCRFRLWDFDGRKYSYKVRVTSDFVNYQTISDKSEELIDGWQRIDFAPRPVLRFLITGVKSTIGNELRLVHFESPAQN